MLFRRLPTLLSATLALGVGLLCAMPLAALAGGGAGAVPGWLKARIAKYEKAPVGSAPQEVWSYPVAGKTVYLLRGAQPSQLLDARGRLICRPDGDKACASAYAPPNQMTAVWTDPRLGMTISPKPDTSK